VVEKEENKYDQQVRNQYPSAVKHGWENPEHPITMELLIGKFEFHRGIYFQQSMFYQKVVGRVGRITCYWQM